MNVTHSIEQISKDLMSRYMESKPNIPKLPQKQTAQQLVYSNSTIKRYRDQINQPSPYK